MRSFKKITIAFSAFIMFFTIAIAFSVQAQAAIVVSSGSCGDDLTWKLDNTGVLTISGTGAMEDYDTSNSQWAFSSGIKELIINEGVTSVGNYAFYYSNIEKVSLPSTLKSIGAYSFYSSELTEISLPEGVQVIEDSAFRRCDINSALLVPESVNEIGSYAFAYNPFSDVYFAGDAPSIGANAFYDVSAAAHYSSDNGGWTTSVRQNYGGDLQWKAATAPVITQQPGDVTVEAGKTASTYVSATGLFLEYDWYFANAGTTAFSYTSSFKDHKYAVVMNDVRDGRRVYCLITDFFGNTVQSDTATLKMGPKITKQPVNVNASVGKMAKVSFTAVGEGLTYDWYFANAGSSTFYHTDSFKGSSYAVSMNAARDGRRVYCVVTDRYGNVAKTDTVTLGFNPKITKQPTNTIVKNGATAKVSFTVVGEGLTYKWYFANAGSSAFYHTASFSGNTYAVTMNAARSGRRVYCVVTDQYGTSVKTDTVTLGISPYIVNQPANVKVGNGKTAIVKVNALGDGLTYKWYFANAGSSTFYYTSSFKGNSYNVAMNASRDGRRVYCVITDQYGNTTRSNTVTLSMSPKITKQPSDIAVLEGKVATVKVTAVGDGLTYKWYFANKGETKFAYTSSFKGNTYSVAMNDTRDGRRVYCVITDKYGNTAKTNTVTLSLGARIVTHPQSVAVYNGETATISFTAAGEGLTYKWYFANAGSSTFYYTSSFKGNSYSVAMNDARNGRQVYCVVTDKYGNSARTDIVTLTSKFDFSTFSDVWQSTWFIGENDEDNFYSTDWILFVYESGTAQLYNGEGEELSFTLEYSFSKNGVYYFDFGVNLTLVYDENYDWVSMLIGEGNTVFFERL